MNAAELILELTQNQMQKGVITSGNNGPHQHQETAVRNSCHWIITCLNCHRITQTNYYLEYALNTLNEVIKSHKSSGNVTYHHRNMLGKDKCNGLIGQAWVIETLLKAYLITSDNEYRNEAIQIFDSHVFNEEHGLWHICEIDGTQLEIDPTFNHQLWFAASISPVLKEHPSAFREFNQFIERKNSNLTIFSNGLIFHAIDKALNHTRSPGKLRALLKHSGVSPTHIYKRLLGDKDYKKTMYISEGYQLFNLYAYSKMLRYNAINELSDKEIDAFRLVNSAQYFKKLSMNKYAYPYNPPGFEAPYIYDNVSDIVDFNMASQYFKSQIEKTFDPLKFSFVRNSIDTHTLNARLYELSETSTNTLEKFIVS